MTEFLFHRNKNTVPVPIGFQLQNLESNYLTQQKPNSALFLFSISNSECESDSHKKCDRNRRKRNGFTYSFTLAEVSQFSEKFSKIFFHLSTALIPFLLYYTVFHNRLLFRRMLPNLKCMYFFLPYMMIGKQ